MARRPAASRACVCAGIAPPGASLIRSAEPATCGSPSRDLARAWARPTGGQRGARRQTPHVYLPTRERELRLCLAFAGPRRAGYGSVMRMMGVRGGEHSSCCERLGLQARRLRLFGVPEKWAASASVQPPVGSLGGKHMCIRGTCLHTALLGPFLELALSLGKVSGKAASVQHHWKGWKDDSNTVATTG